MWITSMISLSKLVLNRNSVLIHINSISIVLSDRVCRHAVKILITSSFNALLVIIRARATASGMDSSHVEKW